MTQDIKNLPTYTKEEVASILTHALDRQGEGGRISHDELLETAREIGMTTLEIDAAVAAEVKLRAERIERIEREEARGRVARLALEEARQRSLRGFLLHAATFAVMGLALAVIDMRMTGGVWWYFVVPAWALGVLVHAAVTFRRARVDEPRLEARPTPTRIEVRGGKVKLG